MTTRAFVTGWPITHSKSPKLHGYWLEKHQIDGSYDAIAVEPADFAGFLKELPKSNYVGGNITLPHKEFAFNSIPQCVPYVYFTIFVHYNLPEF